MGGPATTFTFLEMDLDTDHLQLCILWDKLLELCSGVTKLLNTCQCSKHELPSILGKLLFAVKAVVSGRTFLGRLYDLNKATWKMP